MVFIWDFFVLNLMEYMTQLQGTEDRTPCKNHYSKTYLPIMEIFHTNSFHSFPQVMFKVVLVIIRKAVF